MCMLCALEERPPLVIDCIEMGPDDTINGNPGVDTIAGDTSTTATLTEGQTVSAYINSSTDSDWYRVELEAGETYTFDMRDTASSNLDSYLYLYDAVGNQITFNDDGGAGTDARISYTASTSGTFYIGADAYSTSTGEYTLSMTGPAREGTTAQLADYLVNGYWEYSGYAGTEARDFAYTANDLTVDLTGLTGAQARLARLSLELWEDVADVSFREVSSGGTITFQNTASGAYATHDNVVNGNIGSSTINVASSWSGGNTNIDSYTFQTYIHEIGHALGLGHQGAYNGSATYGTDNVFSNDSWALSVMSYFDQQEAGTGDYRFVFTPQMADILAIQSIYGAADNVRDGNTTYGGVNDNVGGALGTVFDNLNSMGAFTIYDTGGIDWIDARAYGDDQRIDLTGGALSDMGGLTNNVGIYLDTIIENAQGGDGNDDMTGNGANNRLFGRSGNDEIAGAGGNDRLYGQGGNDRVEGGAGADYLNGGGGVDTASYASSNAAVTVDLRNGTASGGHANGDRLVSIENVIGSSRFGDTLRSDDTGQKLYGLGGNDSLYGFGGNDSLFGQNGNDRIFGQSGNDRIVGGRGNDVINGGSGLDRLVYNDAEFNHDTIRNFDLSGNDFLDFRGSGLSSGDLRMVERGSDTIVRFDGNAGHTIRFEDMDIASLDTSDWLF